VENERQPCAVPVCMLLLEGRCRGARAFSEILILGPCLVLFFLNFGIVAFSFLFDKYYPIATENFEKVFGF
jgi:hypothetical protein